MTPRALPAAIAAGFLLLGDVPRAAAHGAHALEEAGASEAASKAAQATTTAPARIVGDVVVIEDDGTMIRNGHFVASRVMPAFYATVPDSFQFVSLFGASTFPAPMHADAAQYAVRMDVAGLGRAPGYNRNGALGIDTRQLLSIQFMNDIRHYGPTPSSPVPRFPADFTGVELLGSETLHAFGMWVDLADTPLAADLAGREDHWSLYLNSDASVMEGCRWRDNGDGTFTSVAVLDGISELDEYLLGLRPAEEVGPMFAISDPEPGLDDAEFPLPGLTIRGRRVDFGIEDVVARYGPRIPDAATAPKHFRMAFALVVPAGTAPSRSDLAFLRSFRGQWEAWFRRETEGLGSMDTSIPRTPPTAGFEVDRIAGNAPVTVRFRDRSVGTIEERIWNFGDGSPPSKATDPVHVYAAHGLYDVRLTVTGAGASDTIVRSALVTVDGFRYVEWDDFESPSGWAVGPPDDAGRGRWEWGDPEGTTAFGVWVQPEEPASGRRCWMTSLAAGSFASDWDVDGGTTTLLSPVYDLAGVDDPFVAYARWYTHNLGPAPDGDVFVVEASSDGGDTWHPLETVSRSATSWQRVQFRLADHVQPTGAVRFRFLASDLGEGSLVEAGVDAFEILGRGAPTAAEPAIGAPPAPTVRPNPFSSRAWVRFEAPVGPVRVTVHDLAGRVVRILEDGTRPAGAATLVWDGRDAGGHPVASGIYAVRIRTTGGTSMRKVVRIR